MGVGRAISAQKTLGFWHVSRTSGRAFSETALGSVKNGWFFEIAGRLCPTYGHTTLQRCEHVLQVLFGVGPTESAICECHRRSGRLDPSTPEPR